MQLRKLLPDESHRKVKDPVGVQIDVRRWEELQMEFLGVGQDLLRLFLGRNHKEG
jgi:hypothetical protein